MAKRWLVLGALMGLAACVRFTAPPTVAPREAPSASLQQPSAAACPQPTPEIFRVEPVKSPTTELHQVISVRIGNGERVTITTDAGEFVASGDITAYALPAQVTVTLKPNAITALKVVAQVRVIDSGNGCKAGGYTLSTDRDRNGTLLSITQQAAPAGALADVAATTVIAPAKTAEPAASATPAATPTPVARSAPISKTATASPRVVAACTVVLFDVLIVRATRPDALINVPLGGCVTIRYKSGEERSARWYPAGGQFAMGTVLYVRRGDELVTVFTKDGALMAREFLKNAKIEDLALKIIDGKLILAASNTPIAQKSGAANWVALVDVLVRN